MKWATILALWGTPALGAEPEVHIAKDGAVVGQMRLPPGSRADLIAVIGDPEQFARLSDEVLSVQATRQGDCYEVRRELKGLTRPLEMTVRSCPTPTGWTEKLVSSDDFSEYTTEWTIEESAEGTEVTFNLRTSVGMWVPASMVRRHLLRSTRTQLERISARIQPD